MNREEKTKLGFQSINKESMVTELQPAAQQSRLSALLVFKATFM